MYILKCCFSFSQPHNILVCSKPYKIKIAMEKGMDCHIPSAVSIKRPDHQMNSLFGLCSRSWIVIHLLIIQSVVLVIREKKIKAEFDCRSESELSKVTIRETLFWLAKLIQSQRKIKSGSSSFVLIEGHFQLQLHFARLHFCPINMHSGWAMQNPRYQLLTGLEVCFPIRHAC